MLYNQASNFFHFMKVFSVLLSRYHYFRLLGSFFLLSVPSTPSFCASGDQFYPAACPETSESEHSANSKSSVCVTKISHDSPLPYLSFTGLLQSTQCGLIGPWKGVFQFSFTHKKILNTREMAPCTSGQFLLLILYCLKFDLIVLLSCILWRCMGRSW